jgi:hypothetical protein
MGVDRPLSHVFASIFLNDASDEESDNAPGFNPFSFYDVSDDGIQDAVYDVEKYIQENGEPNVKIPLELIAKLGEDVQDHIDNPNTSLNRGCYYEFVE